MMFCFAKMMCAAAHEGHYGSIEKHLGKAKASGVFSLRRCAAHIICAADIMAQATSFAQQYHFILQRLAELLQVGAELLADLRVL